MKTNIFPMTFIVLFSAWSILSPFKDAECTMREYFATAKVEIEFGFVQCAGSWGFPKISIGVDDKINQFKVECTNDQRIKIRNFKDTLSVLNNSVVSIVIQKLGIIEQVISQEKIDFKEYQESVNNYIAEIEKLAAQDKKRLEKIFK
ncbi:MAG: hypothetical protein ABI761_15600 [Saprospiraceae bacterium]